MDFLALAALLAGALPGAVTAHTISGRVVDADGKPVAQAVVYVQSPEESSTALRPTERATMDQINKTFVPGVLPIVVGSEVRFPNHDQVQHHVYSFSRTKNFELPLYKGQQTPAVRFDRAGVVKLGCNIHDWMAAVILVLPTTHFALTDAAGAFTIADLTAGEYSLVAWHERSELKPEETAQSVEAGARSTEVMFHLALAPARVRQPMRGLRGEP